MVCEQSLVKDMMNIVQLCTANEYCGGFTGVEELPSCLCERRPSDGKESTRNSEEHLKRGGHFYCIHVGISSVLKRSCLFRESAGCSN